MFDSLRDKGLWLKLAACFLASGIFLVAPPPAAAAEAALPSADGAAYLRGQAQLAWSAQGVGDAAAAEAHLDRLLSLLASVQNPGADADAVAQAFSDALGLQLELGRFEAASGLQQITGEAVERTLAADSVAGALYRLREAQLLQQVGDGAGAAARLEALIAAAPALPEPARSHLLGPALSLRAMLALAAGDLPTADAALARRPAVVGPPRTYEDVAYLAARVWVANRVGRADPAAVQALSGRLALQAPSAWAARAAIHQTAALAVAEPSGPARQARFVELARQIDAAATAGDAAWNRPGVIERQLLAAALGEAGEHVAPAVAFDLVQLAGRGGRTFEADAVAALSAAADEAQRRSIHERLRLTARRDSLVRTQAQRLAARLGVPAAPGVLRHDAGARLVIRDYDRRIAAALAASGPQAARTPLAALARLQRVLAADEALLAIAPAGDEQLYMCVRRDGVRQARRRSDALRVKLDSRLLQAALTAGHPASEALDGQYPAEAAVRLYDDFVRPFEPCLKAGDRLIWMNGLAAAPVPLATLLESVPRRRAAGYDLQAARWLVRAHAVSYAGSAPLILAARSTPRAATDFGFLGVGDPRMDRTAPGFAGLPSLPETRPELEASARPFPGARLLLGDDASEAALRRELLGHFGYLSFATHGLLRQDLQGLGDPALVLTAGAAGGSSGDDGLLTASEIADLNLHARFIALSACNTANYDLTRLGQDLPALTSAFAVAGAPAVLATLWPVDSQTGQQVVAGVFQRVGEGAADPAAALAQAQRAFLDAPPSRAHLHPRFWAPFVLAGDGVAAPEVASDLQLRQAEPVTAPGGEVIALAPAGAGLAASFISPPDAQGLRGAGLRAADASGAEAWRSVAPQEGAGRVLGVLGGRLLSASYLLPAAGERFAPVLRLSGLDGAAGPQWRGRDLAAADALPMAGLVRPDRAWVAVGEIDFQAPGAPWRRVHVLQVRPDLTVRALFAATVPAGVALTDAPLALLGDDLLLAYSGRSSALGATGGADDYDIQGCTSDETTWLELRDPTTGALKARTAVPGFTAVSALGRDGAVLLGGVESGACGEDAKAAVVAVDPSLKVKPLWRDDTLGASQVRALAAAPRGGAVVAAVKATVVEYRPPDAAAAGTDPYAILPFPQTWAGLVLELDAAGRPGPRKHLESGSNVFLTAAQVESGGVALGGAVGGRGAILHLESAAKRGRR